MVASAISTGADTRKMARSMGPWFSGAFMFAFRTKKGTASRITTIAASRYLWSSGDTADTYPDAVEPARPSGDRDLLEQLHVVQGLAAAQHHRADRIVTDHDRQTRLLPPEPVEVPEQRASAGEHDALVDDVGGELGRRLLEGREHGLGDVVDG